MRLKVGLVTGEFPPMEGGVGAFTAELAKALHLQGHAVHIITAREARPSHSSRRPNRIWEPIPLDYGYIHSRIGRWRWPSLAVIADIVLRQELDIVNIQYQPAAFNMYSAAINFLPWRLKHVARTAVTFHDLRVPYLFPKAGILRQQAVQFLARTAHGVIATNPADYHSLTAYRPPPIEMIPIGSNITVFPTNHIEIAEIRRSLGLDPDSRLLGYFGFLHESKGADTLVEALAGLDGRFHLVFIGGLTGASDSANNRVFLDRLKTRINDLGLAGQVHWTGFLTDARVSAYLQAVDLMVMPYRDGASLRRGTLMAALAHARPLITTQAAGQDTPLVSGENCWLVAPETVGDLVSGVQTLSENAVLRQKIGEGAGKLAGQFSWQKIAQKTAEFYMRLL